MSMRQRLGMFVVIATAIVGSGNALFSEQSSVSRGASAPSNLTCTVHGGGENAQVTGTFNNHGPYIKIEVYRDGNLIDTLVPSATQFTDVPGAAGEYEYWIVAQTSNDQLRSSPCTVCVPEIID